MNMKQKLLHFSKQLIFCSIVTFSLASFFFINQIQSELSVDRIEISQQPLKQDLNAMKNIALKIKQLVIIIT